MLSWLLSYTCQSSSSGLPANHPPIPKSANGCWHRCVRAPMLYPPQFLSVAEQDPTMLSLATVNAMTAIQTASGPQTVAAYGGGVWWLRMCQWHQALHETTTNAEARFGRSLVFLQRWRNGANFSQVIFFRSSRSRCSGLDQIRPLSVPDAGLCQNRKQRHGAVEHSRCIGDQRIVPGVQSGQALYPLLR